MPHVALRLPCLPSARCLPPCSPYLAQRVRVEVGVRVEVVARVEVGATVEVVVRVEVGIRIQVRVQVWVWA